MVGTGNAGSHRIPSTHFVIPIARRFREEARGRYQISGQLGFKAPPGS